MSDERAASFASPKSGYLAAASPNGEETRPELDQYDNYHNQPSTPSAAGTIPSTPWAHNFARAWLVWRWRMASNVFAVPLPYWTATWDVKRGDLLITLPLIVILIAVNAVVALSGENVGGSGTLPEITMAFVFIFAVRNNSVLLATTGISYERALFYHKTAALVTIVLTALHAIAYLLAKNKKGRKDYSSSKVVTGSIAFFSMVALYVLALNVIRRRFFELFLRLHWILFIVILLFTVIHGAAVVLIGAVPWLIDVLFRLFYRPRVYAKGTAFPTSKAKDTADVEAASPSRLGIIAREQVTARRLPGGITSLQFPRVRADTGETFEFKPGQYAFLCVPEIGILEWHPFSISSAPHEDTVTFHIRSLGDWTSKLSDLVSKVSEGRSVPVPFDLFVDGPYGTLSIDLDGHLPTTNYSHVVMLCGGIGITPMRSIVNQLHYESFQQKKRSWMRSARLVWAVRGFDILSAFMDLDQSSSESEPAAYLPTRLLETTPGTPTAETGSTFRTEIFVTDESSPTSATIEGMEAPIAPQLAHMLKLNERPNIAQILRETGERAQMESAAAGRVAVLVCGPDAMVKDAISASIPLTRELGVRFDVHHEYFHF